MYQASRCPGFTYAPKNYLKFYSLVMFSSESFNGIRGGLTPRLPISALKKAYIIFMRRIEMATGRKSHAYGFMMLFHFYRRNRVTVSPRDHNDILMMEIIYG